MKAREELDLILKLIRKYELPLSPILEYAINEKKEEHPNDEDGGSSDVENIGESTQTETKEAPITDQEPIHSLPEQVLPELVAESKSQSSNNVQAIIPLQPSKGTVEHPTRTKSLTERFLMTPIKRLALSSRAKYILSLSICKTLQDVAEMSEERFRNLLGCDVNIVAELKSYLGSLNLGLGLSKDYIRDSINRLADEDISAFLDKTTDSRLNDDIKSAIIKQSGQIKRNLSTDSKGVFLNPREGEYYEVHTYDESNPEDRTKLSVLDALKNFSVAAFPTQIISIIDKDMWGEEELTVFAVERILRELPEVEYVHWGKYRVAEEFKRKNTSRNVTQDSSMNSGPYDDEIRKADAVIEALTPHLVASDYDKPMKYGQRWTNDDDEMLLKDYHRKLTVEIIAGISQRTISSVIGRLYKLLDGNCTVAGYNLQPDGYLYFDQDTSSLIRFAWHALSPELEYRLYSDYLRQLEGQHITTKQFGTICRIKYE